MKRHSVVIIMGILVAGLSGSGPVFAGWSTSAMSGDGDCGISTNKTYTHAVDLGNDTTALTINGIPFHQGSQSGTDATHGGSYVLADTPVPASGHDTSVTGDMHELLEDFYYAGNPSLLYLNGLEAGTRYVTRFYVSAGSEGQYAGCTNDWTANDSVTNVFRVDRSGGHTPGAIISYEGTAQAGGLLAFEAARVNETFHFYGFTVEEAATENDTDLISDLFNTGVDAQGRLLATGAADPHYTIAGPQLPGTAPQAMVTIPHTAWSSGNQPFSRWIGPANGSVAVAGGTYTYTTTFTIGLGQVPTSAQITGYLFADDINVSVYLNGVRALTQNFHWGVDDTANTNKTDVVEENANAFTIVHGQDAGDGPVSFQAGQNTLVFSVPEAAGSVQGLRTYGMKGTVSSCPAIVLDGSTTGDSIDEGLPSGTLVGSLAVINTNTTFSYSLVDSDQYPDNASFDLTGDSSSNLVMAEPIDYETKPSYTIRVQATETGTGNLVLTNTFTITVNQDEKQYFVIMCAPNQESMPLVNDFPAAHPGSKRQVAFSPMLLPLCTSTNDLRSKVIRCLDSAEQSGYPLCFHVDDWNHGPTAPGQSPSGEEWRNDPEMIEWTAFPEEGEEHGPLLKRRWLHWADWEIKAPSPNFESPKFRELMRERLADGIAKPIAERVAKWKQEGRSYLFAGIVVGWETGYYTINCNAPGMEPGESNVNTGYAALHARGHNAASVAQVASDNGITSKEAHKLLMVDVKHDYTEFLTRTVHECGISTSRIYTHYPSVGFGPYQEHYEAMKEDGRHSPIEATINPYSRTGYTGGGIASEQKTAELLRAKGRSKYAIVEHAVFPDPLDEDYPYEFCDTVFDLGATMITIFGWWGEASSHNVAGVKRWLDEDDGIWSGPPPAGWSTKPMHGDADSEISTTNTYTHAVDLGDAQTTPVTINGVPFHQGGRSGTDATHGGSYVLAGTPGSLTGYNSPVTGDMHELMGDFYHSGNPSLLYLNGLETGTRYVTRFYVSAYSGKGMELTPNDSVRSVFRVDRSGGHLPGAIISYEGTAQAGGLLAFQAAQVGGSPHFYGFTVEEAAIQNDTQLIADLFNTGVDAQGHLLAVGAADPHYTISGPQLPGTDPQAMVTIPNVAWNSGNGPFSRWIGPANGDVEVAGGTYTYTTTFTIEDGVFPATAQISGYLFADDVDVTVYLNGVRALSRDFPWTVDDKAIYSRDDVVSENANAFSIVDGQSDGEGPVRFQAGQNTLVFSVPEVGGGPSGLRTYGMKGTVSSDTLDIPPATVVQDSFDVPGGTWQEFNLQTNQVARQEGGAVNVTYASANTNTQCLTQVYLTQTEDDRIGNGTGVLVMRNAPSSNGGTSIGAASAVINEDLAPSLAGNRYEISYSGVLCPRDAAVINNPTNVLSWYHSVSLGGAGGNPGEPNQAGADLGFLIEWDGTAKVYGDGILLGSKVVPGLAYNVPFDVVLEIDEVSMSASVSVEVDGALTDVGTFDFDFDEGETARRLQFHSRLHTVGLPDNPGSFDAIVDAHVDDLKITASVITKNYSVPHQWLTTVMGVTSNYDEAVFSDTDDDGFLAWEEYWSGTDPTSSELFLRIDGVEALSTNIRLSWEHAAVDAGIPPIHVQSSTDLVSGAWVTVGTNVTVDGVQTWDFVPENVPTFYRLSVPMQTEP